MQDMNELRRMGMVTDGYMRTLEDAMEKDNSLDGFKKHLDSVSGGNKGPLTANQRKRKRKARRVCA